MASNGAIATLSGINVDLTPLDGEHAADQGGYTVD
jgi:hypothetical protein